MNRRLKIITLIFCLTAGCIPQTPINPKDTHFKETQVEALLIQAVQILEVAGTDSLSPAYSQARAALDLARQLKPGDARILDGIGCIEWRRGNFKEAEYFFKKAVSTDTSYDAAYVHLALVAERNGDIQASKELLQTAITLTPLNYRAHNNLAAILLDNSSSYQDLSKAYDHLLKANLSSGTDNLPLKQNLHIFKTKQDHAN